VNSFLLVRQLAKGRNTDQQSDRSHLYTRRVQYRGSRGVLGHLKMLESVFRDSYALQGGLCNTRNTSVCGLSQGIPYVPV